MYSGHIDINCSPPLGTSGYYQLLSHSQRYIDQKLWRDSSVGFPSGKAFLDCIRLLLAKISILDWTSLDESNQKLQLTEVRSKLPGMMRTGCLIPMDHVSNVSQIQPHMKDDLLLGENNVNLQRLCLEYPEMAEKWVALNCSVVTFYSSAKIEFEAQGILAMLQAYIPYRGAARLSLLGSVQRAVLSRNQFAIYKPILVFFSDGQPHDPRFGDELTTHISDRALPSTI